MTIFDVMDSKFNRLKNARSSAARCRISKEMLSVLNEFPELQQVWKYNDTQRLVVNRWVKIEPKQNNQQKRTTTQINDTAICWGSTEIHFLNNCKEKDTACGEKTYLFKFYTENEIIFSKIGTTAKNCLQRLKDEIRYYTKRGFNITKVEICEIIDCGETPAESYESYLRALFIKKFPNTWKKNDRFFGISIPVDIFTKLCTEYAAF